MAAENKLDFVIAAHVQGMEQLSGLINRVSALEKETQRLKTANAGLSTSTDAVIRQGVRYNNALDAQSKQLRQTRQGTQQLGMQINDFATSVSTGASPLQAFNQQLGQVGYALSDMGGTAGKVGAFLAGPWGAAIVLATAIFGPYIAKLFEAEEKTNDLFDASKGYTEQATAQKLANAGLVEITDVLNRLSGQYAETLHQEANAAIVVAKAKLQEARGRLAVVKAMIAENRAKAEAFKIAEPTMRMGIGEPGARSAMGAAGALYGGFEASANTYQKRADEMEKQVGELDKSLAYLQENGPRVSGGVSGVGRSPSSRRSRAISDAAKTEEEKNKRILDKFKWFIGKYEESRKSLDARLGAIEENGLQRTFDTLDIMYAQIKDQNEKTLGVIDSQWAEMQSSFESIGNTVSDAFKGMLTGAMSWKDGMRGIINAVIDELWRLYVVQQIVGMVTKFLGGAFGHGSAMAGVSAGAKSLAGRFPGNANGTPSWRGGMTWVGERGPELINVPRGASIIPAHRAQNMAGGGMTINVDARGSADPAAVRRQVEQGIIQAAPAIIAAAEARTVAGLRRPKLGGVMQ